MSENLIEIKVPINKTYFTTFINSLIPIHFYNDNRVSLDSLKNLLFTIEQTDTDFNNLVRFVTTVADEVVRTNKETNLIKEEFSEKVFC
jgi:hypothetical protein